MPSKSIARKNMKRSKLRKRTSRRTRINRRQNTKRTRINKRQNTKRRRLNKRQNTKRKFNRGGGKKARPRRLGDPEVLPASSGRAGVTLMKQEALMEQRRQARGSYDRDTATMEYRKRIIALIPSYIRSFERIKEDDYESWSQYISKAINPKNTPGLQTIVDWAEGLYNRNYYPSNQTLTSEGEEIIYYQDGTRDLTDWAERKYFELFGELKAPRY